ncbi:hypothetical protein A0257_07490 [Hymenobacter psoromatis]|nr:hypothetical protein A0257_07490 [Hymenobacter psoromatis]
MSLLHKSLAINSVLILLSASIIGTVLHELAHYVVSAHFGLGPTLHHNYVNSVLDGTPRQQMLVAAAGPVFSLLLGVLAAGVAVWLPRPSLTKLFLLWLGMDSILGFLGYLLIAPIAKEGDTGLVFAYFGVPLYAAIALAAVVFVGCQRLYSWFATQFVYYKNAPVFDRAATQKQLFLYPIFSVIVLLTQLSFPIITWVSLLPTIFLPMTYFSTWGAYRRLALTDAPMIIDRVSVPLVVLTVAMVALFRYLV